MTDPNIHKIAHNAKYDYTILDLHGLRVSPITFDTMIGEWLTNPATKHKGLKDLARHRLGIEMTEISRSSSAQGAHRKHSRKCRSRMRRHMALPMPT